MSKPSPNKHRIVIHYDYLNHFFQTQCWFWIEKTAYILTEDKPSKTANMVIGSIKII